ncbi:unnamed protein product [Nippostrongylus brasiliensis]|uniref:Kunitz/Bovine pancreatic trypsin inhibitor domain protein n=1 Tax=Nippostrongylus brasiliensis TaxID=27835 RepID=A0A0N4XTR5_NIPBR|nr:unnamed protein product [Nippostrongylus brasiliensis]
MQSRPSTKQRLEAGPFQKDLLLCLTSTIFSTFSKRKCLQGKIFNKEAGACESVLALDMANDDPFAQPFNQAPGYVCRMYERTGTSYCCQGSSPSSSSAMCSQGYVTYLESSGKPRSCVLSSPSSCPTGFGCTLVAGTTTRCCGKDLGCPHNSAALLNPNTASMVECSPSISTSCQQGFSCVRSSLLKKFICCSATSDNAAVCPAGSPLSDDVKSCDEGNHCKDGYECVTTGSAHYCCPSRGNVCGLPRHSGVACANSRPAVTRYYFDVTTGSCRSFQFSQCGGNANNFNSLEECEGFCLDTQCQHGQSPSKSANEAPADEPLRPPIPTPLQNIRRAYRVGAVNAVCALTTTNTCPQSHSCMSPVVGPSAICCPVPASELSCNEVVSAGTPCFGRSVTIQRFYFNPSTRKCHPFQYYGCNGNGNNFQSMQSCQDHCLNALESVCGGAAALIDPNQQPQRCSATVPCPAGYECNSQHYCCPSSELACSAPMSRGNVCSGMPLRTSWYYDKTEGKCKQFAYSGCGGSANRFVSRKACISTCVSSTLFGACPRGMTPIVDDGDTVVKNTLEVLSSIPGFHMCCSTKDDGRSSSGFGASRKEPNSLAALIKSSSFSISPCPGRLTTNGQPCTVNAVGKFSDCPRNFLCFRDVGYDHGSCCRTGPPKCSMKQHVPIFVSGTQQLGGPERNDAPPLCCCRIMQQHSEPALIVILKVQICQTDLGGCPRDSRCMTSNIPKVSICCKAYNPHTISQENTGGSHLKGHPKCRNGDRPLIRDSTLFECSFADDDCPSGYKCEFSSSGQPVCCGDSSSIRCPAGSSAYEYGGRPLACPVGSTKCPQGYSCVLSLNPQYHLCCSTNMMPPHLQQVQLQLPQCRSGSAFVDPALNQRQFCSPLRDTCPIGYQCMESDYPGQYICCTQTDLSDQFKGYCPSNQIPFVSLEGIPPTCHMQLNPCPTTAPYICIYSPMKQSSYCCTPADAAFPGFVDSSAAASPMRRIGSENSFMATPPPGNPYAGTSQSFPGGYVNPDSDRVAIPDPIPGILPPSIVAKLTATGNGNNFNVNNNGYGYPRPDMNQNVVQNMVRLPNGFPNNQYNVGEGPTGSGQPDITSQVISRVLAQIAAQNLNNAAGNSFMNGPERTGPYAIEQHSTNRWAYSQDQVITGCPLGSKPLVRADRSVVTCNDQSCPNGFWCVFAEKVCIVVFSVFLQINEEPKSLLSVLFAGQKGCLSDEQCSAREVNATCDSGYCVCPASKPLVHGGKCVASCSEGFANIAGRCYDPTTVIFMDSVDERKNGTIGGYCLDTLVEEKRCVVGNSYCSEKTITCQCKIGFSLVMDFKNKEDEGSCEQDQSSKYKSSKQEQAPVIDDELYFVDIGSNAFDTEEMSANSTQEDDIDVSKYLYQTDELVNLLA